ncbi:MAG TPA: WecB/TagA/CpsF family glycosyltransferase [Terracidiphilus sp.]|jgi:N-acetylglucosaminyldiphosphoundecaprenol N-acetyl-beta-D-mannosaminyltransferase|nr:WecB/TagA/CpsF family glycosyltransferase [Terracidiphilus sp.]
MTRSSALQTENEPAVHPSRDPKLTRAINVLGIRVDVMNMEEVLARLAQMLRRREKGYLSAITVHGVMVAQRDKQFAAAFADASIAIPDGTPIAWAGRLQGFAKMHYVTGPALMREVFLRKEFSQYTHFFYGGDIGVAEELAQHFQTIAPWAKIVGAFTPPYRSLTRTEECALIAKIRRCKPDMIWIGLGTPKQDKFMRHYLPLLETKLMFGVGAAFDFHTGRIRGCPAWVKSAGLHWLHRLLQEPRRLWRRYLFDNPVFIWSMALQLLGLRTFIHEESRHPDMHSAETPESRFAPCSESDEQLAVNR